MRMKTLKLSTGDWVEVRSKEEILRTLDSQGQLDGMPFMPEMFAFCGKRFQVYKRAHKTCDTVFPVRGRRVDRAVHLETRCSGQAHGGCQAGCLIFWKEAWLRPLDGTSPDGPVARVEVSVRPDGIALDGPNGSVVGIRAQARPPANGRVKRPSAGGCAVTRKK